MERSDGEENYKRKQESLSHSSGRQKIFKDDFKYKVTDMDVEKIYHREGEPLRVRPKEIVTVRNICSGHQDCGFLEVINQFSESGYIQKRQLQQPSGEADTSFCFFSSDCQKTFSCPRDFEEHACFAHEELYEELKQHITKGQKCSERGFYCPQRGCSKQFFYLDEIIIHYGVEHHRVQNIIFNHLRRTSIHEEHRRDCDRFLQQIEKLKNEADEEYKKMEEDRQKIKRLEIEMDSKSKLLEEKLQEVAKLEGKLKEKNKKIEDLYLDNETLLSICKQKENRIFHLTKKNQELKKQLGLTTAVKEPPTET